MRTHQFTLPSDTQSCGIIGQAAFEVGVSLLQYDTARPHLLNLMLLPLLKQLGEQSHWQLWLTPAHKLDRHWLECGGVPLEKSIQVPLKPEKNIFATMVSALKSGNFSIVLAWHDSPLTDREQQILDQAAIEGGSLGLIMRAEANLSANHRHGKGRKTPMTVLH